MSNIMANANAVLDAQERGAAQATILLVSRQQFKRDEQSWLFYKIYLADCYVALTNLFNGNYSKAIYWILELEVPNALYDSAKQFLTELNQLIAE